MYSPWNPGEKSPYCSRILDRINSASSSCVACRPRNIASLCYRHVGRISQGSISCTNIPIPSSRTFPPTRIPISLPYKSRIREETTGFRRIKRPRKLGGGRSRNVRPRVPWRVPSGPRPSDLPTSRASDPPVTISDTSPIPWRRTSDRTCL